MVRDSGTRTDATADAPRTDAGRTDAGRDVQRVDVGSVPDADDTFFTPRTRGCQCSTVGATHTVDARWGAAAMGLGFVAMMRRRRRR
jgi:MYXO-CTERM domain-containing protein